MTVKAAWVGIVATGLGAVAAAGVLLTRGPATGEPPDTPAVAAVPATEPSRELAVSPSPRPSQGENTVRRPSPPAIPPAPAAAVPPVASEPLPPPVTTPVAPVETPLAPPPAVDPPRYVPDPPSVAPPPAPVVEPPPLLDELKVEKHSVIGIRLDVPVSSRTARVEDRISATVIRDVQVQGRIAIAEGARLEGTVVAVDRGGKFRERPRLSLRFDTLILTDGTRLAIRTDTIVREGLAPSADATAKVGAGAIAGAILGAVIGGKTGAAIGGAAGAAGGAAVVQHGDGEEVALRAGAALTVRLTDDLVVQVQRSL